MNRVAIIVLAFAAVTAGCSPSAQRAGTSLSGVETPMPSDWRFTDATKEIQIQVHTPYLIPHSVTIWCAQVDGTLYVGASAPQTKRWPGWVDSNPDVRLSIDGHIYPVRLVPLDAPDEIALVRAAYATKYQLDSNAGAAMGQVRYWRVAPRETPSA